MSLTDWGFSVSADDWNQDGAWYNTQPLMERMGIKVTRATFKQVLRKACKELRITREELNIVASPWATMYYKGVWTPIGYEDIASLSKKGTDIIFTEKADAAKLVGKYASKDGVAFVNTRGHLSDYADDVSDIAEESGGHIAIFVDYDIPGILIASKLVEKGVLWLGVNEDMLRHFGINKANKHIVLTYAPKKKRMTDENFKELVDSTDVFRNNVDIEFLKHKKIELNAPLSVVGPKRLWEEYFKELLGQTYPIRDYNRALESHPDLSKHYPMGIRIFHEYIKQHENSLVAKTVEEIETELKEVKGFINVPEKEAEIDEQLGTIIEDDELLKDVGLNLEEMFKRRDPKRWEELANKIKQEDEKEQKQQEEEDEQERKEEEKEKHKDSTTATFATDVAASGVGLKIQDIEGVGPTTARKLKEAGIVSVTDLATIDVDELAININSSKETAQMFIMAAKKLLEHTQQKVVDINTGIDVTDRIIQEEEPAPPTPEQRQESRIEYEVNKKIAETVGISVETMDKCNFISEHASEKMTKALDDGYITVDEAYDKLHENKTQEEIDAEIDEIIKEAEEE